MAKSAPNQKLYVIAYDIPNDKRRTKLHKLLSGFGQWTQYSLFECHLNDKQYLKLRHRLDTLINAAEDSIRFYGLCAGCIAKVETIGSEKPNDPTAIII